MKYRIKIIESTTNPVRKDIFGGDIIELEPLDCPAPECDYMKKARIESMLALQNVYPRQEDTNENR